MKTIEEIINRHFATEKELDIIRIPPKFDFQNENQYFEVKGEMNYFVKIKKNLKKEFVNNKILEPLIRVPHIYEYNQTSVYKGYKQDKIEMRGDRAEISDFPLYLNTVAGGLDRRDQTIGGFSFVVKIYAVPVVEIIG